LDDYFDTAKDGQDPYSQSKKSLLFGFLKMSY